MSYVAGQGQSLQRPDSPDERRTMFGYEQEKWQTFSTREKVVRAINDEFEKYQLTDNVAKRLNCKASEYPFKIITLAGAQYDIKNTCISRFLDQGDIVFHNDCHWIITGLQWFEDRTLKSITAITCENSWLGQFLNKQTFKVFHGMKFYKIIVN